MPEYDRVEIATKTIKTYQKITLSHDELTRLLEERYLRDGRTGELLKQRPEVKFSFDFDILDILFHREPKIKITCTVYKQCTNGGEPVERDEL